MRYFLHVVPLAFILMLVSTGCSSDDDTLHAPIEGQITVSDSLDSSGDDGGIHVSILKKDSAAAAADTLFYAVTNKGGFFSGEAHFNRRGRYLMRVSRNGQLVGQGGVILAANDSLKIFAKLPAFSSTLQIYSKEHNALTTYNRVERSFQRVAAFARAGQLKGDSLVAELQKWPDIYWQVYQQYPQTIAGGFGARRSIELLSQWNPSEMMQKVRQIQQNDDLAVIAAVRGKNYLAKKEGAAYALAYLDTLQKQTNNKHSRMRIEMERINLMYDSAMVKQARQLLHTFKKTYDKDQWASEWAKSMTYDLEYLAPGDPIPAFSFTYSGHDISRENMKGRPYLLEITPLSSPQYQQQYDRTLVIYNIYKNYDLEVITIPLDTSQVTIDAFFEERMKPWPVASSGDFDRDSLIKTFNIKSVPVRFLVDEQGRIARRYIGPEYEDVIQGIQQLIKSN